ncbi:MAG: hypothetical protein WC707_02970 [Candidatus Babeliaceae bacterium]|jgi:hypothetical protein
MKKNLIKLLAVIVIAGQAQTTLPYDWGMFGQGTAHFFSRAYHNTIGDLPGYQQAGITAGIATILVGGCGFFIYKRVLSSNHYRSETEAKTQAATSTPVTKKTSKAEAEAAAQKKYDNLKGEIQKLDEPIEKNLNPRYDYTNENNQTEYYEVAAIGLKKSNWTMISLFQRYSEESINSIKQNTFNHATKLWSNGKDN